MYHIGIKENGHIWEKQNLVTIMNNKDSYDIVKCKKCGIIGKIKQLGMVEIKSTYSKNKIFNCTGLMDIPKQIKITICRAQGQIFSNLTPNSIHTVINAPDGYKNDNQGVWVMGVGEPVKVLTGEFIVI